MGLQEEVLVAGLSDAAVDYGTVFRIRGAVGVASSRRIEPSIVAFTDYNYSNIRETPLRIRR